MTKVSNKKTTVVGAAVRCHTRLETTSRRYVDALV